jgi:hypothetical protein
MMKSVVSDLVAKRMPGRASSSRVATGLVAAAVSIACSGDDGGDGNGAGADPTGIAGTAGIGGEPSSGGMGSGGIGAGGTNANQAGAGGTGVETTTPTGDPPPSLGELAEDPAPVAPWTILVYGHADHTLSNGLLTDLQEMNAAQLGNAVQLVVLADWDASQQIAGSDVLFPDGLQLYRVLGSGMQLELLAQGPEANLDDPVLLASIVRDVFTALPAERRGLILWDHGGSWQGGFGGDTQNRTTAGSPMAAPLVADAVRQGLAAAGFEQLPPLDFFAFDTCLMAGAEVAYPFRDLAQVYIADAEIDYGAGWDYATTLTYFAQNPTMSMTDLATAEVSHWDQHHSVIPNDQLLRSHAALNLSQLDAFAAAAAELTRTIAESETFDRADLARSAFFALSPYSSQFEKGSNQPGLRDLGQVLSALATTSTDPAVGAAATTVRQLLNDIVLASAQGTLRIGEQMGVHVEQTFGSNLTEDYLAAYRALASDWIGASRWDELLVLGSSASNGEPPLFEHTVINAEGATREAPPVLQFSTADANAAKAAVRLAVQTPSSSLVMLGLVGAGLIQPGVVNDFAWDGSVISFADGQQGMLDIWLDVAPSQQAILTIPGLIDVGLGELFVTYLVFGAGDFVASVAVVASGDQASTLTTSEIVNAFPGATFSPVYWEYTDAPEPTLLLGNPIPVPPNGFELFSVPQPAGTYVFSTELTDIWGNISQDIDVVTLVEPLGP